MLRVADKTFGLGLRFTAVPIGLEALRAQGTTLPDASYEAARAADGVILGPVETTNAYPPAAQGGHQSIGRIAQAARSVRQHPSGQEPPRHSAKEICGVAVDLVIARENTEGFYADRDMFVGSGEFMPTPDVALSVRKITREGCTRIAEVAFALAMRRRKKVTAVPQGQCISGVGNFFPRLRARGRGALSVGATRGDYQVDAMAAYLVRDASRFDVVVTTNMFGDILSDEASEVPAASDLHLRSTTATSMAWRRRSMAPPPTSPVRIRPIPPR